MWGIEPLPSAEISDRREQVVLGAPAHPWNYIREIHLSERWTFRGQSLGCALGPVKCVKAGGPVHRYMCTTAVARRSQLWEPRPLFPPLRLVPVAMERSSTDMPIQNNDILHGHGSGIRLGEHLRTRLPLQTPQIASPDRLVMISVAVLNHTDTHPSHASCSGSAPKAGPPFLPAPPRPQCQYATLYPVQLEAAALCATRSLQPACAPINSAPSLCNIGLMVRCWATVKRKLDSFCKTLQLPEKRCGSIPLNKFSTSDARSRTQASVCLLTASSSGNLETFFWRGVPGPTPYECYATAACVEGFGLVRAKKHKSTTAMIYNAWSRVERGRHFHACTGSGCGPSSATGLARYVIHAASGMRHQSQSNYR
ncbi:hypothetical protein GGX14DRAFT_394978 [Mycena pura]|uniref:Uncharacterized protein n=1 Tax=Mycena pura TaxID=153505 RepID=A0AAD6YBN4_9AGAR|nr:hypothetical protein GGX14DRAFT_394978 [Mycena pura]